MGKTFIKVVASIFIFYQVVFFVCAESATVRGKVVISDDKVRLSDIFDDLEPGQDRVLGPAPPPGESIQVGGGQLIAIADEYGVDWIDQSSSAVVNITRSSRILDKNFFIKLLKENLDIRGDNISINFFDFHPIMVSLNDQQPVSLSNVHWDQKSGRLNATIYRNHPLGDITKDSFALNGMIYTTHPILVFSHSMLMGEQLSASDLRLDDTYSGHMYAGMVSDVSDVDGMTLQKNVSAGDLALEQDFRKTIIMKKGSPVIISFDMPGVHLTATGKSLDNGGHNQYVHVLNIMSKMIVLGKVVSGSEVKVESGLSAISDSTHND